MVAAQADKRAVGVSFKRVDIPCFVQADRGRLKQILINILANAIKYNEAGGTVTIDIAPSAQDMLRVSVRNTGAGLAPEQLAQLFDPFNRLGQESHGEEGTGIGLVICQRLTESMAGVIGADSTLGMGCTFWIELKRTAVLLPASGIAAATMRVPVAGQGDAALRTLLYVEDNPANLLLVEEIVARRPDLHLLLLSATDGRRGVAMARAARPDVILMDVNLPDISGTEAMQILAEDPATAHIPVLALSANAMPRDVEKGLKAGFFRYLTKPIKVNELLDTLEVALKFAGREGARGATR